MDWSRAKNVLLIVFLVVNVFLGYKLMGTTNINPLQAQITDQQKSDLDQKLNRNNLELQGDIPEEIFEAEFFQVSTQPIDLQSIVTNIIGGSSFSHQNLDNGRRIISSQVEVFQNDKGFFEFYFPDGFTFGEDNYDLNEDSAVDLSQELINHFEISENLILWNIDSNNIEDDKLSLTYYQETGEHIMFGGYLDVTITNEGVTHLDGYLLEKEGFTDEPMEVIPANMALLRLMDQLSTFEEVREITDLSFGYYTDQYLADKWEAVPVWRIEIEHQGHYYINSFTGDLENKGGM